MENKKRRGNRLNKEFIEKNNNTQIALSTFLLLLGIVIGVSLTANNSYALDTATSSRATTSNATTSNATTSNATSSNATSSNATSSNATSSNINVDTSTIYIDRLTFNSKEAKIGEKVELDLLTNIYITQAKLLFKSEKGNQFTVYLSNLNDDEYFEVPTNVTIDNYYLSQLTMEHDDIVTTYTNGNNYDFNIELKILDNNNATKVYNNEEVNEETIKNIASTDTKESKDNKDTKDIIINATGNSVISKEVFNSIKGTEKKLIIKYQNNEVIFNGKDIIEAKDIDASIKTTCISDDETSKIITNNGYVVNLSDNGTIPGKEIIRIKATQEMKDYFGKKKLFVYYYDKENSKFTLIAKNITSKEDFYEFAVEHNSKYILTDTKINNKTVEVDENIVDFQNSNKINILITIAGIILVIAVIMLIVLLSKNNKENKSGKKE